jgi:hypothetical protein
VVRIAGELEWIAKELRSFAVQPESGDSAMKISDERAGEFTKMITGMCLNTHYPEMEFQSEIAGVIREIVVRHPTLAPFANDEGSRALGAISRQCAEHDVAWFEEVFALVAMSRDKLNTKYCPHKKRSKVRAKGGTDAKRGTEDPDVADRPS